MTDCNGVEMFNNVSGADAPTEPVKMSKQPLTKKETFAHLASLPSGKKATTKGVMYGGIDVGDDAALVSATMPNFGLGAPPPIQRKGAVTSKFGLETMKPGMFVDVAAKSLNTVLQWGKRHSVNFESRSPKSVNTPGSKQPQLADGYKRIYCVE